MNRSIFALVSAVLLTATMGVSAKSNSKKPLVTAQLQGTHMSFSMGRAARNTSLTVAGPNGYAVHKFEENGMPSLNLRDHGPLKDGLYHYEIVTAVGKMVLVKDTMNNGRGEDNSRYARKGITQSGHFRVVNGQIKSYRQGKEPSGNYNYNY